MSKRKKRRDPIGDFVAWQDRQYVLGYWATKTPRALAARSPRRAGLVFLGFGVLLVLLAGVGIFTWVRSGSVSPWMLGVPVALAGIGVLQIIFGVKVLRKFSTAARGSKAQR